MTTSMDTLADVVERNIESDRRRALRALLLHPLLPRTHPAHALVRRHAENLRAWLARETGWALAVEDDFARLRKEPGRHADATRGARLESRPGTPPFSRRRYALLCLALADLERGESQVTLGWLGEGLVRGASDPALGGLGLAFRLTERDERRDLVAVVRLLLEFGVLTRVAGEEDSFVRSPDHDVLYDVNRRLLSALLAAARGPSLAERDLPARANVDARIAAITERYTVDTQEARNAALRRRLAARLLDDPVVYSDELSAEERGYLASQRPHLVRRIEEATGLAAEIRGEGLAMVDPTGELTDEHLPSEGTEGHATLLLAEHLARARAPVPLAELHARMRSWITEHRRHWRKSAREPGAEVELSRQGIARLCALGLAVIEADFVRPLPAIGRHALGEPAPLSPRGLLE